MEPGRQLILRQFQVKKASLVIPLFQKCVGSKVNYKVHYIGQVIGPVVVWYIVEICDVTMHQRPTVVFSMLWCVDSTCGGPNVVVSERVGRPLFQAMIDFNSDKFDSAVDELMPVKYDVTDGLLSGSRAQVVNVIIITPVHFIFIYRIMCLFVAFQPTIAM